MHKILVITLYFPLDALHVSHYISPSSGATLQAAHRIWYTPVYAGTIRGFSHTTARRIGIYQMRCAAYKSCS